MIIFMSALCAALVTSTVYSEPIKPLPGEVEALLDGTDDLNRGASSHSVMTMRVKTKRYDREMKIEAWTQGKDRSLLKVLSPKRDAGVATLKVDDEAWNYLPKIDRTLKISASAMGGAWMGSHLTNDDLVRNSRMRDDYTWILLTRPQLSAQGGPPEGAYHIELTPKPDAAVVWGKVSVHINAKKLPIKVEYWNERGVLKRTMTFLDYRETSGRSVPMRMRITPSKVDEFTEVIYNTLDFGVSLSPRTFSLQALKR
jgi:hypothetical protein